MALFRKRRAFASAQEQLPLEAVEGDVVRLRGGEHCAVLETGSVNFALKSETEQEAILAGYRRFLNGLTHPLQVLVRVVPTDVEGYLAGARAAGAERGAALTALARDHERFVRRMARERTLLDRRFYAIVPAGAGGTPQRSRLPWRYTRVRSEQRARVLTSARRRLTMRCEEVMQGLAAFGVAARRLEGDELTALWRATLGAARRAHPHEALPSPVVVGPGPEAEAAGA